MMTTLANLHFVASLDAPAVLGRYHEGH